MRGGGHYVVGARSAKQASFPTAREFACDLVGGGHQNRVADAGCARALLSLRFCQSGDAGTSERHPGVARSEVAFLDKREGTLEKGLRAVIVALRETVSVSSESSTTHLGLQQKGEVVETVKNGVMVTAERFLQHIERAFVERFRLLIRALCGGCPYVICELNNSLET